MEKILQLTKERPGVLLKNQTFWSKQNPFPTTLKQWHAKPNFQISHLLRNTGLRNSEPVSRAAKASRLGHREEIPEMTNIQWLRHGRGNIVRRTPEQSNQELDLACVRS